MSGQAEIRANAEELKAALLELLWILYTIFSSKTPLFTTKGRNFEHLDQTKRATSVSLRALVQLHGFDSRCTVPQSVSAVADVQSRHPIILAEEGRQMKINPAPERGQMRDYSSADVGDQLKRISP
ncbi:hypothetical protein AtubIFM55763_002995 [Aspergillus tubingensis]|nr:hypothetical protein AtubIFM54640_005633 [Aspergillus tubingensis]GLA72456.1 hypothetical protein AtubIFM55763_002995 [Aspergillus tubingensis]GLA91774.1 hypothetical protein AtubIFM57143_005286 [Aspergillus tubingensis]GLB17644.1 hypothetical protein AtubIFM61612_007524 [Aspergillus tubingensis]